MEYEGLMKEAIGAFYEADYFKAGGLEGIGPNQITPLVVADLNISRANLVNPTALPGKTITLHDAGHSQEAKPGSHTEILVSGLRQVSLALAELKQAQFPFLFESHGKELIVQPLPDTVANRQRLQQWVQQKAQKDLQSIDALYRDTLKRARTMSWGGADEWYEKASNESMLMALHDQACSHVRQAREHALARLRAK